MRRLRWFGISLQIGCGVGGSPPSRSLRERAATRQRCFTPALPSTVRSNRSSRRRLVMREKESRDAVWASETHFRPDKFRLHGQTVRKASSSRPPPTLRLAQNAQRHLVEAQSVAAVRTERSAGEVFLSAEGLVRFLDDGHIQLDRISSSAPFARSPSIARTLSSPAMTRERKTGPASHRNAQRRRAAGATSLAFSTGSSISSLPRASTSSCRGHGPRPEHPIASPPDAQRRLTKAVGRQRRLRPSRDV